jgi:uncharacterized protein (TIGR02284 family)
MSSHTVNTITNEIAEKLNDLIRVNLDSYDGFNQAAEDIDVPEYANLFRELGQTRKQHANELQEAVRTYSEVEPETKGSATAKMHRWWIDLREKITTSDAFDVLAEAERGEDHIKHMYEDILPEIAGSPINDKLNQQYAQVKAGHDKVRDLRDANK